jgi:hypothetical protein
VPCGSVLMDSFHTSGETCVWPMPYSKAVIGKLLFFGVSLVFQNGSRCKDAILNEHFVFIWRNACTVYVILFVLQFELNGTQ